MVGAAQPVKLALRSPTPLPLLHTTSHAPVTRWCGLARTCTHRLRGWFTVPPAVQIANPPLALHAANVCPLCVAADAVPVSSRTAAAPTASTDPNFLIISPLASMWPLTRRVGDALGCQSGLTSHLDFPRLQLV